MSRGSAVDCKEKKRFSEGQTNIHIGEGLKRDKSVYEGPTMLSVRPRNPRGLLDIVADSSTASAYYLLPPRRVRGATLPALFDSKTSMSRAYVMAFMYSVGAQRTRAYTT